MKQLELRNKVFGDSFVSQLRSSAYFKYEQSTVWFHKYYPTSTNGYQIHHLLLFHFNLITFLDYFVLLTS